jgi:hypothetical protein
MNAVERVELISCLEAGSAARSTNVEHADNPHLQALSCELESPETHMMMERVSAWWDGWEETDKALSPGRVWDERTIYF